MPAAKKEMNKGIPTFCCFDISLPFCLSTGVLRHNAGGVGTFVFAMRMLASNGSRELHHSYYIHIYTSENVFIALGWRSEMIMGCHEYTYQDH